VPGSVTHALPLVTPYKLAGGCCSLLWLVPRLSGSAEAPSRSTPHPQAARQTLTAVRRLQAQQMFKVPILWVQLLQRAMYLIHS